METAKQVIRHQNQAKKTICKTGETNDQYLGEYVSSYTCTEDGTTGNGVCEVCQKQDCYGE